jgi:predicted nucleotidyltransferase
MSTKKIPADPIGNVQYHVSRKWASIDQGRASALTTARKLERITEGQPSTDANFVVFGSLARREWTPKSDVDWTLLIDGQADYQHLALAQEIAKRLDKAKFAEPGRTGIFGNMTFSHDLVQKIGGQDDTNQNTTRRILLLLESLAIGRSESRGRVRRLILKQYLNNDYGLRFSTLPFKVPRVLLNDIVRYWRTVTVDFLEKQRMQAGQGWGLRNAKLRMSRKLIFATGLLSCFSCDLLADASARQQLIGRAHSTIAMEEHLRNFMERTPLEILATVVSELRINKRTSIKLFSAYDEFLALMSDSRKRDRLKRLTPDSARGDKIYEEMRKFSHSFQEGLTALFFKDHKRLQELVTFYGVF